MEKTLRALGVRWTGHVSEDFAATYDRWPDPSGFVELLHGIGEEPAAVYSPLLRLASASPAMLKEVRDEARWGTPEAVFNAYVDARDFVSDEMLMQLLRHYFPLQRVAAGLMRTLQCQNSGA